MRRAVEDFQVHHADRVAPDVVAEGAADGVLDLKPVDGAARAAGSDDSADRQAFFATGNFFRRGRDFPERFSANVRFEPIVGGSRSLVDLLRPMLGSCSHGIATFPSSQHNIARWFQC